jgi:hypothetical protein
MKQIKNAIVGSADVDPFSVDMNDANWRTHPTEQKRALEEALTRVGWVQRVIVNKNTNRVVDGHLRLSVARSKNEPTVPVTYVDLSDDDERLALATFDPIGSLAFADKDALSALLGSLDNTDEAIGNMLTETAKNAGIVKDDKSQTGDDDGLGKKPRPKTHLDVYVIVNDDDSRCCAVTRAGLLYATETREKPCRVHPIALYAPQTLSSESVRETRALRYVIRCASIGSSEGVLADEVIAAGAEPVYMPRRAPIGLRPDAVVAYDLDDEPYPLEALGEQPVILFSSDCNKLVNAIGKANIIGIASAQPSEAAGRGELILWDLRAKLGGVTAPMPLTNMPTVGDLGYHVPNPMPIAIALNASTMALAFNDEAALI